MIIFFPTGRLGNQLFQYCAIRKFDPTGIIIVDGWDTLKATFNIDGFHYNSWINQFFLILLCNIGKKRIERAAQKKIITTVQEVVSPYKCSFNVIIGKLHKLVYFKESYYQSENMVPDNITSTISIKREYIKQAQDLLNNLNKNPKQLYFLHVRRGDYLFFPDRNYPAVLPFDWYQEQMKKILRRFNDAFFIVISDDYKYIREKFLNNNKCYLSDQNMQIDFAIMSQCLGGGILSASSFAWWGAYFCRRKNKKATFIAPYYWGGHRKGIWYPEAIKTSWIDYYEVN